MRPGCWHVHCFTLSGDSWPRMATCRADNREIEQMTHSADLEGFLTAIDDVPAIADRLAVRRKSRDMTAAFSPVMRQEMKDKFADVVVRPRSKGDVLRGASAAGRNRMPLVARGAGPANFGQGIPLRGGAIVDMTALDKVVWIKGAAVRAECG